MAPHPLPQADSPAARRLVRGLFRFPAWAHHPTCRCFDQHLIRLGRLTLCLGCTCLGAGLIIAVLALLWAWQHERHLLDAWRVFGIGMVLFTPTFAQPFLQYRAFKAASRFSLGVCIPFVLLAGLVLPPLTLLGLGLRVAFVGFFVLMYRTASWQRRRYTPDPCQTCPYGRFPFCPDNLPHVRRLLADSEAREFAGALRLLLDENPERARAALSVDRQTSDQV